MAADGDDGEFGDFSSAFPNLSEELTPYSQDHVVSDPVLLFDANENGNLDLNLDFSAFSFAAPIVISDEQSTAGGESFEPVPTVTKNTSSVSEQELQLNPGHGDLDSLKGPEENETSGFGEGLPGFQSAPGGPSSSDQQTDEDWGDFGGYETAALHMPLAPTQAPNTEKPNIMPAGHNTKVFVICFRCPTGIILESIADTSNVNFSWLLQLQKSIDFTVPLCKWDTSYLQACYYSSIKVDPVLVTKADVAFVAEVAQLAVVDGQSAALDLMESFGFEGGVEPTSPTDPGISFFPTDVSFPTASHSEPTLLDLSLPNSPSEDLKEDSFTLDADLQGLELQSLEAERQKTSIEQLALNERLVINRTTWIDSELEQLGDIGLIAAPLAQSQSVDQNKGLTKKASFQEQLQQLGLDTSKTSFTSTTIPTIPEMSISARLILDRLPNLSFMLQENVVAIHHHYYH